MGPSQPKSVGEIDSFIAMLQAACADAAVYQKLERLLSLPDENRRSLVNAWVSDLLIAKAPRDFTMAIACLLDDAVAEKAYEVIYRCQRPARSAPPPAPRAAAAAADSAAPISRPTGQRAAPREPNFIVRSWQGREKLWKVYWLYVVLLGQFGAGLFLGAARSFGASDRLAAALLLPYLVWACVSLWRCSFNVGARIWGYLMRFILVCALLLALPRLAQLFG